MIQSDIDFLEKNKINFDSIELGFTREIAHTDLNEYQRIYQEYLDKSFYLNAWCGACVFDMLKRIKAYYEGYLYIQKQSINQTTNEQTKNTSRRRKA